MTRVIADGEVKVTFVSGGVTTKTAPAFSEVDGGTEITGFLQSLDTPLDGESVDSSDLSSAFNKNVAGTFGGGASGTFYRDDTTDTAWTTFPRNTTGDIIVRRFGGSTVAFATGDAVEVWPVRVITRSPATMDRNSVQSFNVDYATTDEPALIATVT
jgi:hypothetical protein